MDIAKYFSWFQSAKKKKNKELLDYLQSYHYQRGIELYNQGRDADAFEEFKLEKEEHPENGVAYLMIAGIHYRHDAMGGALQAANYAIPIFQATGNAHYLSQTYYIRGQIYRNLRDEKNWYNDIQKSLEYDPDSVDSLGELGDYYYYKGDYDASDIQFNKIINLEPHNPYGYVGRGRNDQGRNEHRAAIAHFEKAIRLDANYATARSFMAESLVALDKITDAIDAIIAVLNVDIQDQKVHDIIIHMKKTDRQGLILKVKAKAIQHQDNDSWYRLLGWLYAGQGDMKGAILAYQNGYKISHSPELLRYIAYCWSMTNAYDKAIETINQAIEIVPHNTEYKVILATYHAKSGQLEESIADITTLIEQQPDDYQFYYSRGRYYFELDRWDEAINDFNTALSLKDDLALALLYKGWALSKTSKEEEAAKTWQMIVEKNKLLIDIQYAYGLALYFLGLKDEAVEKCNSLISESETNILNSDGELYVYAAAVYCRTQKTELAIECLKKNIDTVHRCMWPMYHGKLLEPLFENEAYQNFMNEVNIRLTKEKMDILEQLDSISENQYTNLHAEIPFVREGKMCKVKCEINGLPLHFIFDTGASDVTMSSVEATFMLKNGYLNESDLSGKQYYTTADGSIAEGVNVCLNNVVFAGLTLKNVKAGIVATQSAPLLLGQSVLERLGRIEIDNEKMLIKINS